MVNCLFCKIIAGEVPCYKVYEDEQVLAFLDIYPKTKGHTLIIPKVHAQNMYDIPSEDIMRIASVAKVIATSMRSSLKTAGVNLLQSNEPAAQQEIMHFHLHVIPRYNDDQQISFAKTEEQSDLENLAQVIGQGI